MVQAHPLEVWLVGCGEPKKSMGWFHFTQLVADARVRVRMSPLMDGSLDSLNVNVAASIVLEHVFSTSVPAPPAGA